MSIATTTLPLYLLRCQTTTMRMIVLCTIPLSSIRNSPLISQVFGVVRGCPCLLGPALLRTRDTHSADIGLLQVWSVALFSSGIGSPMSDVDLSKFPNGYVLWFALTPHARTLQSSNPNPTRIPGPESRRPKLKFAQGLTF
jgi:hypothetical protein